MFKPPILPAAGTFDTPCSIEYRVAAPVEWFNDNTPEDRQRAAHDIIGRQEGRIAQFVAAARQERVIGDMQGQRKAMSVPQITIELTYNAGIERLLVVVYPISAGGKATIDTLADQFRVKAPFNGFPLPGMGDGATGWPSGLGGDGPQYPQDPGWWPSAPGPKSEADPGTGYLRCAHPVMDDAISNPCKNVGGLAALATPISGKQYWEVEIVSVPRKRVPDTYTVEHFSTGSFWLHDPDGTGDDTQWSLGSVPTSSALTHENVTDTGATLPPGTYVASPPYTGAATVTWPKELDCFGTPLIGVCPEYMLPTDLRGAGPTDQPKKFLSYMAPLGSALGDYGFAETGQYARSIYATCTAVKRFDNLPPVGVRAEWHDPVWETSTYEWYGGYVELLFPDLNDFATTGLDHTNYTGLTDPGPGGVGYVFSRTSILPMFAYMSSQFVGPGDTIDALNSTATALAASAVLTVDTSEFMTMRAGEASVFTRGTYPFVTVTDYAVGKTGATSSQAALVYYANDAVSPHYTDFWLRAKNVQYRQITAHTAHDWHITRDFYQTWLPGASTIRPTATGVWTQEGDGLTEPTGDWTLLTDWPTITTTLPLIKRNTPGFYGSVIGEVGGYHSTMGDYQLWTTGLILNPGVTPYDLSNGYLVEDASGDDPKWTKLEAPGYHAPVFIGEAGGVLNIDVTTAYRWRKPRVKGLGDGTDMIWGDGNPGISASQYTGVDLGELVKGDRVMLAVDTATGKIWFGKNGRWIGPDGDADPANGHGWAAVLDTYPNASNPAGSEKPIKFYPSVGWRVGAMELILHYGRATKFAPPSGFKAYGA